MTTTKDKIITAAIQSLAEHDYHALSLRKVSQQAGVTTGAFYQSFHNKNDLFYQMTLAISADLAAELIPNTQVSAFDQLITLANQINYKYQQAPYLMDFLFFNPSLSEVYQQDSGDFPLLLAVKRLVTAVNPGSFSDDQLFLQIWAFSQGYMQLVRNGVTQYSSSLIQTTLRALVGGKGVR